VSEAAHRTPPGKDAGVTEINPSTCKVAFSGVDIIFFQQHANCRDGSLQFFVLKLFFLFFNSFLIVYLLAV